MKYRIDREGLWHSCSPEGVERSTQPNDGPDIPLKLFTFPPKPLIKKAISSLASLVRGPARKEEESAKERFSRLFPDQSQFDKTVRQLITFGLVRISEDSLSVHPVIQEYFRRV
ncbi:hypothetical protein ACQZV8_20705, partial [Magnetococcales bacterium HHB-1]